MPAQVWSDAQMAELAALLRDGRTAADIAALTGLNRNTVSCRLRRYLGRTNDGELLEAPEPESIGPMAGDVTIDPEEAWRRLEEASRERLARKAPAARVSFPRGPVCLVHIGDLHAGNKGVDYPLARDHAEIVGETPGMYLLGLGDLLDNFVHAWAMKIRIGDAVSIPTEWAAVRYWLSLVAPKMIGSVDGNHEAWTASLAGIDYFKDVLAAARPGALYRRNDLRFTLDVGGAEWRYRVRHKWRGSSQYNATHAIEKAHKWDQDFDVGVGGHVHTGAYHRSFNAAGREGLAIQVGTYKIEDDYADTEGFSIPNRKQAVAVIYRADRSFACTTNLDFAAEVMSLYYRREV